MKRLFKPEVYLKSIFAISPEALKENGIEGLILDIDNTLVATHIKEADEQVKSFIMKMKKAGIKLVILSNAGKKRAELFCTPLGIEYVYKAHKPFCRGFKIAIQKMNLPKDRIAIVGDQLFTDVLGGNLIGIRSILLKPIDLNEPFFIKFKRIFEKPFLATKEFDDKY